MAVYLGSNLIWPGPPPGNYQEYYWNTTNKTWIYLGPGYSFVGTAAPDKKLYVGSSLKGIKYNPSGILTSYPTYNPTTDSWGYLQVSQITGTLNIEYAISSAILSAAGLNYTILTSPTATFDLLDSSDTPPRPISLNSWSVDSTGGEGVTVSASATLTRSSSEASRVYTVCLRFYDLSEGQTIREFKVSSSSHVSGAWSPIAVGGDVRITWTGQQGEGGTVSAICDYIV